MTDLIDKCPECEQRNTQRVTHVFGLNGQELTTYVRCPDCQCWYHEIWRIDRVEIPRKDD